MIKNCMGKFDGWLLSCCECEQVKECIELKIDNNKKCLLRQANKSTNQPPSGS